MDKKSHISSSLKETEVIAVKLLKSIEPTKDSATVVFLTGNLGAGKTAFTSMIAKSLGIKGSVVSPTFILEKKYTIPKHQSYKKLIHIDAYRFETPKEAVVLDLATTLSDPQNLVIVEWPSKLGKSIQADIKVSLVSLGENTKKISW